MRGAVWACNYHAPTASRQSKTFACKVEGEHNVNNEELLGRNVMEEAATTTAAAEATNGATADEAADKAPTPTEATTESPSVTADKAGGKSVRPRAAKAPKAAARKSSAKDAKPGKSAKVAKPAKIAKSGRPKKLAKPTEPASPLNVPAGFEPAGLAKLEPVPGTKPSTAVKPQGPLTLAVDIGGTGMKAEKLDRSGRAITGRIRINTPNHANPQAVVRVVRKLARAQTPFDRVSVGFPGVLKDGVVYDAPNLGKGWNKFNLLKTLEHKLGKPVRVANDADVQGLGAVSGRGVELVITLGTGFGSVIFVDGHRIHMELGHAPFHRGKTYEDELGMKALTRKGKRKWNRMLREAIDELSSTFNYDQLYIGGGNARHIDFKLPGNVHMVSNEEGLLGGIRLWTESHWNPVKASRKKA